VAGLFLLDDPHTDRLVLPDRYGVDDIPLILQDRTIRSDNTLDTSNLGFGAPLSLDLPNPGVGRHQLVKQ
jgi:hypothetical protein